MAAPDESAARSARESSRTDESPVQDRELDALFAPLAAFRSLILAVSGGADSMALMLLARRWSQMHTESPKIMVATVDHGLRAESRAEADWVIGEARALGIEAHLLTWSGEKPQAGIQDAARTARYRLLSDHALSVAQGPAAVVTAHTEDDQAETLLMRLARGSGLDGLAAMAPLRAIEEALGQVVLARPLLGVSGKRLRATLRAAGRTWLEDPSNEADRFERVRIRKARARLAELGLENHKIALSARRLARAKDALETCVDDLQRTAGLDVHGGAYASFDAGTWSAAPEELRLRLLGRLIAAFGGQAEPLNLGQLEALVLRMSEAKFEGATLGGAAVSRAGATIHVHREAGRAPLPTLLLAPGAAAMWDRRFRVVSAALNPTPVEVRALGAEAYAGLRRQLELGAVLPANAAATLPAFWREGELLFVPVLANLPAARGMWEAVDGLYSAEFLG
ncbi:MAG: tRNA lysidine(34) synthetase TilS [Hyphomicrobium sp.]